MVRPFRFGLSVGAVSSVPDLIDLARRAEDLGYSSISLPDHLDDQLAPLVALAAVAPATTNLRLSTLVLCNDYRHPALLAKEIATLDQLSGGRVEFGIGAGWMTSDYAQSGIGWDPPGTRIARLSESVAILKGLFSGQPVTFTGDHYQIDDLVGTPLPHQSPHPPMTIAGGGPKILTLAAHQADIIELNPGLAAGVIDERAGPSATPSATDQKLAWIREAAGPRFGDLELQTRIHLAMITNDRNGIAEAMAPVLGLSIDDAKNSPHALVGTVEQCIESLHQWRERWGISYIALTSDTIEEMTPVVAALAGS